MRACESQGVNNLHRIYSFTSSTLAIAEAQQVFEMKKSLEIPGDLHEQFFRYLTVVCLNHSSHFHHRYLKGSSDGFKTVSDFFGRGVFTPH
jgi:hypothetical protein